MTTILKNDTHILTIDIPGERPRKHILENRYQALELAKTYLFKEGMVTIYDANDTMIYRHAHPFRRKSNV